MYRPGDQNFLLVPVEARDFTSLGFLNKPEADPRVVSFGPGVADAGD